MRDQPYAAASKPEDPSETAAWEALKRGPDQPEAGCAPHLDPLVVAYREQIAAGRSADDTVSVLASELYPAMPSTLSVHLAAAVRRLVEAEDRERAAYERGLAEGKKQAVAVAWACQECGERHVFQWRDPADQTRGGSWASRDGHSYQPLFQQHEADRLEEALVGPWEPAPTEPASDLERRPDAPTEVGTGEPAEQPEAEEGHRD